MAGGRAVETSPIFVFRMTFYVHRGSRQARVYPRRWLSLSSRAKHSRLKGGIDVSSAISPSIRLFEELLSLLVNSSSSGINRFCKKYRIWCNMIIYTYNRVLFILLYSSMYLLLFSSNFWCKYCSRSLYYSPKQEALLPVTINAPRRVC